MKFSNDGILKGIINNANLIAFGGSNGDSEAGILSENGNGASLVAKQCYNALSNKGFSRNQIIGILCNICRESEFNPRIVNNIGASGLCQWLGARKVRFRQIIGKEVIQASPTEQMNFAVWELNNTEKLAGERIRNANTVVEAVTSWVRDFERPGNTAIEVQKRLEKQSRVEQLLA